MRAGQKKTRVFYLVMRGNEELRGNVWTSYAFRGNEILSCGNEFLSHIMGMSHQIVGTSYVNRGNELVNE